MSIFESNTKNLFLLNEDNTQEIISCYGIKNYLLYKCTFPYELDLSKNVYCFFENIDLKGNIVNDIERKIVISHSSEMVENQRVLPPNNKFVSYKIQGELYSYRISYVNVYVQVMDNEINKLKKYFKEENTNNKISFILQNALHIFAKNYNESLTGKMFINPIVSECGAFRCALFTLDKDDKIKVSDMKIISNYSLKKIKKNKILDIDIIKNDNLVWRYYLNKAINSYDKLDNLDCILSSAISIEAYVMNLIKKNNLEKDYEVFKKQNNNCTNFFLETKFLKYKQVISKNKKDILNSCFSILKDNRNEIVHGNLDNTIISRDIADKSIKKLIHTYKQLEKNKINNNKRSKGSFELSKNNIQTANKLIELSKYKEALKYLNKNIRNKVYLESSYYNKAICYMYLGEYDKSIKVLLECEKNKFVLPQVYRQLGTNYINIKKYDMSIKYLKKSLKYSKEVYYEYTYLGYCYRKKGNLNLALKYLNKSIIENPSYDFSYYMRGEVFVLKKEFHKALNDINRAIKINPKYEYLYCKAGLLISSDNIEYKKEGKIILKSLLEK